jgi:hypothetical protein
MMLTEVVTHLRQRLLVRRIVFFTTNLGAQIKS